MRRRAVDTVGNRFDRRAHEALGIVHQVFAGAAHRVAPIAAQEIEKALRPDLGRGDLSLHVADHEIGNADVVAHHVPDHVVALALVDDLERFELQALGVGVDSVDDAAAARRMRADIEVMRRRHGEADQRLALEDRDAERATSGPCEAPP